MNRLLIFACMIATCLCENLNEGPVVPILPVNPTLGGRPGNPGAALRLTKHMLFKDVQKACRDAERKPAEQRSFSDFSIPAPDGRIVISRPRIASLTLPVLISDLIAPKTISWTANDARLTVMATWTYISNNNSINHTGQVYIPSTLFDAAVNTSMGRNAEMQPAITSTSCFVEIADFKPSFTAPNIKARQIIDEMQANVTKEIQGTMESDMCDLLTSTLQFAINKLLMSFQTKYELWSEPKILLDYSLIADPFVDTDCSISMWLKGMMTVNGRNSFSFNPHDFSHQNKSSRMIDVLFSDYLLNSLLQSAFQQPDMLRFAVNSNFSKCAADSLQYECEDSEMCLGKAFPQVVDFPADWFPEVDLSVTRPPTVVFLNGSAYLQAHAFMRIDMKQHHSSLVRTNLASLPISLVSILVPKISKDSRAVAMDAKVATLKVDVFHPKRAEIVALMRPIINNLLNGIFNRGVPIPMFMMQYLRFYNTALSGHDRALLYRTDFQTAGF